MAQELVVKILGDATSLEKAMKKSERATRQFGGNMDKTVTKTRKGFGTFTRGLGLVTGAIGVAGLAGAVKAFATEALDAQKVTAQTNAAIKSTGGVANVTAKHVDELANSMLKKTGIDDEAIKTSENMLLTFTKIRNRAGENNDIFDQATASVADLATAMNKGAVPGADQLQRASIQLGKALNDPVKGITALSRVGIQFTKQQKDQIKTMVDAGDKIGAQKVILAELNKEVGGRAVAAGKTFQGQWAILRETVLNLGGAVAQQLMPAVQRLLTQLVKWLNNSKNQKQILDTVKQITGALAAVVKTLADAFRVLNKITGSTKHTLELLFAVLVAYKGLKIAGSLANTARSIGLIGRNARSAQGGVAGLRGSLVGKAGLVGAVGVLSFELTTAILKITHLDQKLSNAGGRLAEALGFADAPAAIPGGDSRSFRFLRNRATKLRRSGLSTGQTAARLHQLFPNVPQHDIAVAAGAAGHPIQVNVHIDGKKVATATARHNENEAARRRKQRAGTRRR